MHYRETSVWLKAMEAARETYRLVPLLPREETYGMRSQLTRAVVSIPANIAEGWARESLREKAQFLAIAQGFAFDPLRTDRLVSLRRDGTSTRST